MLAQATNDDKSAVDRLNTEKDRVAQEEQQKLVAQFIAV